LVGEPDLRDFAALFAYWRHGTPALCEVLERRKIGEPPTGSDLETLCLQVLRRGGVPRPQRQMAVRDVRIADGDHAETPVFADFGWHPLLFVVETDGLMTHKTREQQLYDIHRQNYIIDCGYDLRRFTWTHVTRTPNYVCRETMRGLRAAGLDLSKTRKLVP
jgi:hypothetical protein